MPETALLVGKFVFLFVLYVFIFYVVRSSNKELRMAAPVVARKQWRMPGAPAGTQESAGGAASAGGARTWTLAVRESGCIPVGAAYVLPADTQALAGRSTEMDIFLDDTFVSAKHALFEVAEEGLWVEDLRSTNGTEVNGASIDEPVLLDVGDRVAVGDTVFEVELR